jgi:hypothetical protein
VDHWFHARSRRSSCPELAVAVAIGHDHPVPWPLRVAQMGTHSPAASDQLSELALVEVQLAEVLVIATGFRVRGGRPGRLLSAR